MFRASTDRFRSWLTRIDEALDDVLGDPLVPAHVHPHRVPLRLTYERRGGSVPPGAAHCISPVRAGRGSRRLEPTAR
jgi:hypothetical protein